MHHRIFKTLNDHLNGQSAQSQQRMTDHAMSGNWQGAAQEYAGLDRLNEQRHQLFRTHKTAVLRNMGVTGDE